MVTIKLEDGKELVVEAKEMEAIAYLVTSEGIEDNDTISVIGKEVLLIAEDGEQVGSAEVSG